MSKIPEDVRVSLNEKLKLGHKAASGGNAAEGCDLWMEAWEIIVDAMDTFGFEYIEDFDAEFRGIEFVTNWASDFEMELGNAARKNESYAKKRIDFCSEYIRRYRDQEDYNILNMKMAIAESYFLLGQPEEGEKLLAQHLDENPSWGWGWIGWADQYWLFAQEKDKDSKKAIDILKRALAVEGLENRSDVQLRLKEVFLDMGMKEEADAITIKKEKRLGLFKAKQSQTPTKTTKVGRNEPCSCGSGKKYKKCCGA